MQYAIDKLKFEHGKLKIEIENNHMLAVKIAHAEKELKDQLAQVEQAIEALKGQPGDDVAVQQN